MISPNRECPSMFLRDFYISLFIYMIKKGFFLTRRLFIVILQSGFLQTFIQLPSFIFENGVNFLLRLLLWEGGFLFLFEWWRGEYFDFYIRKYVIKCLIMLCIFVFTMGQLLRVQTGAHEC